MADALATAGPVPVGGQEAPHPITIAVTAIGGQGGGVLAEWIVATAEAEGWLAQSTSVPGVAQRTGATVYYIELFPKDVADRAGREPVLALMPVPGDVDVAMAAEWMEAGRAVARGFVTPDRTVLIASTHRDYAIREKAAPGAGMEDDEAVWQAAQTAARRLVAFDMRAVAQRHGTVISAALFGALAGSGVLPFARESFEAAIRAGGRGVDASLAAFAEAHRLAQRPSRPPSGQRKKTRLSAADPDARLAALPDAVRARITEEAPAAAQDVVALGVARLIDYQDGRYAIQYLDRLRRFTQGGGEVRDPAFYVLLAKRLAVAMSYEDVYRVADLKTRRERLARLMRAGGGRIEEVFDYFHPRIEEFADSLPAPLGRLVMQSRLLRRLLDPVFRRGRTIRTSGLPGFLLLRLVAALRRLRPVSLRHRREMAGIDSWLDEVAALQERDPALARLLVDARSLVKGYGDTHARSTALFAVLRQAARQLAGSPDAARKLESWIARARKDPDWDALTAEIRAAIGS